ncbi:MAG: hypothetical protein ISS15_16695 [Alphaproteobacteria bacterium]|nr:hypothetical protein [Alphaproteobacteria bacterium]MBL6937876.1 hypothetical protein [Alphaproteobacteria bacterium]MBL7099299.1 hypothetical protein [Alphaproteobacteria bacterium]
MKSAHVILASIILAAMLAPSAAQVGNTNGSSGYTPSTPNPVGVPFMPTMYINGGGANATGTKSAQFLHDWGKFGMEAARDCDRADAAKAIATLQSYLNSLDAQYTQASAAGQDGSVILNDASVVASIINYIRQALAACAPPQGAMLVPSDPPGTEYASAPSHSDNPLGNITIGIGIGGVIGGGDHHHHDDHPDDHPHD